MQHFRHTQTTSGRRWIGSQGLPNVIRRWRFHPAGCRADRDRSSANLCKSRSGRPQRPAQTSATVACTVRDEAAIARAWGYADSDLTPDPAIRFGVLPNGMRYAIRHNATPPRTAVMRLLIDVGSTAEADDERGLAHFIEHMAFNGTTNVPEGEMVKILERLGLAFGADTNAFTSYDQTGYLLDLPNVQRRNGRYRAVPAARDRQRDQLCARGDRARARRDPVRTAHPRQLCAAQPRIAVRIHRARYAARHPIPHRRPRCDRNRTGRALPQLLRAVLHAGPHHAGRSGRYRCRRDGSQDHRQLWQLDTPFRARHLPYPSARIDTARADEANVFTHPAIDEVVTAIRFSPYVEEPDSTRHTPRAS